MSDNKDEEIMEDEEDSTSYSDLIIKGLSGINDDLLLDSRRDGDIGLNAIIAEYSIYSTMNSSFPLIEDLKTGKDLKIAISKMPFEDQLEITYIYLSSLGRIDKYIDYEKEVKNFGIKFLKISAYVVLFLLVILIGGVLGAGIIRNDIDTNQFLNIFIEIVNKVIDIWFLDKNSSIT